MLLLLLEVGGLEDLIHVDLVARDEEVADPEEVGHGGDHRETVHVAGQVLLKLQKPSNVAVIPRGKYKSLIYFIKIFW